MKSRSISRTLALMLATMVAGLALRFAPLGLSAGVVKYGGSTMWALMIYWVVSTALPRAGWAALALIAGLIATAVEFFKLYRSPGMDAFRMTLPGILLLGKYFSWWDIVAYWIAIAAGAMVDWRMRRTQV